MGKEEVFPFGDSQLAAARETGPQSLLWLLLYVNLTRCRDCPEIIKPYSGCVCEGVSG